MYEATLFGQNWVLSAGSSFPVPKENSLGIRMSHPASGSPSEGKSLSEVKAVPRSRVSVTLTHTWQERSLHPVTQPRLPVNTPCLSWHLLHSCSFSCSPLLVDNGLNGELFSASSKSLWPQLGQGHTECHQCWWHSPAPFEHLSAQTRECPWGAGTTVAFKFNLNFGGKISAVRHMKCAV